jgi:hypothetical protein
LASSPKRRKSPRSKARWPITIITSDNIIAGESRNITANGIFTHCKEKLHEKEVDMV